MQLITCIQLIPVSCASVCNCVQSFLFGSRGKVIELELQFSKYSVQIVSLIIIVVSSAYAHGMDVWPWKCPIAINRRDTPTEYEYGADY